MCSASDNAHVCVSIMSFNVDHASKTKHSPREEKAREKNKKGRVFFNFDRGTRVAPFPRVSVCRFIHDEALGRKEVDWDPSPRETQTPNCCSGDVFDTPPPSSRATIDAAAFDPTQEYCTRDIVFFWQPPFLAFRNGRLPVLRLKVSLIPAANSSSLWKRAASSKSIKPYNTACACLTPACSSNMDEKSVTSISSCGNANEKKKRTCRLLRQVRSKPGHANPLLGHKRQTSRGN